MKNSFFGGGTHMLKLQFLTEDIFQISQFQFLAVTQILLIIGMYGVFIKAGVRSKIVFVPFIHWIKLGEILEHEWLGIFISFFGILRLMLIQMYDLDPWEGDPTAVIMLKFISYGFIVCTIIYSLATIIMFKYLVDCSGKSMFWVIPFAFLPGLTMTYWGMNKNVRVDV